MIISNHCFNSFCIAHDNSFTTFFSRLSESCKTYYLSYLVALFATVLWIIVISFDYSYEMELGIFYELLATCAIAFPLFLLWPLYNQTRKKPDYKIVIVTSLIGTVLSLLFAWYVAHYNVFDQIKQTYRVILSSSIVDLIAWGSILATVAYAHPRGNLTTRWRWKELFVHIVIAWLGSAILRGGIAASLGSIDIPLKSILMINGMHMLELFLFWLSEFLFS